MARRKMSRAEVAATNRKIDAHNKAWEASRNPPKPEADFTGPWMKTETLARLPHLRKAFDTSRAPYVAAQIRDLEKTESQRREEQTGRGSSMIEKDKAAPAYRPHGKIRDAVDGRAFNGQWMKEQREAAMAAANSTARDQDPSPAYNRTPKLPEM